MEIDASHGEGGGQIVRTAAALAAVTGTEITLDGIRAGRDDPGLKRQHIACIEVLAAMCDADVDGAELGSRSLLFAPGGGIAGGRYEVDIGTAGSTTLLAQAVLPAAVHADDRVQIVAHGGTDVAWSPAADYVRAVTLPLLERAAVDASFAVRRRGFYPEGGGAAVLDVRPGAWEALRVEARGRCERIRGVSAVADLDRTVAERQRRAAAEMLAHADLDVPVDIAVVEEDDPRSTGTSIALWAEHVGTVLGGSALGEPGKPAEDVGREAARTLLDALDGPGTVDRHAADQLVPYVALLGGRYVAPDVTTHLETNAWVCRRFDLDVAVEARDGSDGVVVSGTGDPAHAGTGTA